jgi:beta-1,4-galactosyltransferase 1
MNIKKINIEYSKYLENRKKIHFIDINIGKNIILNKNAKIALIIPYRNRKEHLSKLIEHFNNTNFDIYVIEQYDEQKFNKGILLNIAFNLIINSNKKYDYYIFNDVDSLPDDELLKLYYYSGDKIIHYASPYLGYKYKFPNFFGGCIGFTKELYISINGFPNNFYGWGGEDDAVYNRVASLDLKVYRPSKGSFILLEHEPPKNKEINFNKKINILNDLQNWKKNGLNSIKGKYKLIGKSMLKKNNLNLYFYKVNIPNE